MPNTTSCELLKDHLAQVLLLLSQLDDSNFFLKIEEIKRATQEITELRNSFPNEPKMGELRKNNPEINDLAKQIQSFIDNIISSKESESAIILKKLLQMQNYKKIVTYKR